MKKSLFIASFLLILSAVNAQTGYSYLNRLPVASGNICSMTSEQQEEFLKTVRDIIGEMNKKILEMKKRTKADVDLQKDKIEKDLAAEYGLSNSDIQKMKNKKLSKEEKKAIADKMMQEKIGMSMAEISKLKSMSKEGKKQWAEAFATQQQANLSGNPDSNKTEEQVAMEKRIGKDNNTLELAKEQQMLMNKIAASDKIFANKMNQFLKDDSIYVAQLRKGLKPLEAKMNGLPGPSEEEAKSIKRSMKTLWTAYCGKSSPKYIDILGQSLTDLKANISNFDRLEELSELLGSQTIGLNASPNSKGLMQIEAVKSYASLLLNTFKYGASEAAPKLDSEQ